MEDDKKTNRPRTDDIVREFPAIGKYRIRVLKRTRKGGTVLDVREYVTAEKFEGYTRRGIVLSGRQELEQLLAVVRETIEANLVGATG